jgi:murein DD-endopeptidase MepM/ murein hydrolase activator NlpD
VIRILLALLGLGLLLALSAGPGIPASTPPAAGSAYALRVSAPGQAGALVASIGGQASTSSAADGYAYPADGSVVRMGPATTTLAVESGGRASVQAGGDVVSVSIFNGEITADGVSVRASASADAKAGSAATDGSTVQNVVALGQPVAAAPGAGASLADWGSVVVLAGSAERGTSADAVSGKAAIVGLRVTLTADHGGLPAGSEIVVGYADASASMAVPKKPPTTTSTPTTTTSKPPPATTAAEAARAAARALRGGRTHLPTPPEPKGGADGAPAPPTFRQPPVGIDAELTPGRYVFPVYGPVGFGNTFGAARASTGWHHGEDIFGTLGQPILAVADGTIFSVGWNDVGGYRLWLRDRYGNQYYYAHLSAYSSLAVNGREVKAGQVIAFMGNTGEAITTPVHLHFEIHPVSMLQFGYDGAIAPYPYLLAWQRLQDVPFAVGAGWVPVLPIRANAPRPGAILLQSSDISSASGLDPQSLERALVAPTLGGDGALAVGAAPEGAG